MLKKLLRYDLKWCFKVVVIYYALGLIFSILGRLLELGPDSVFFKVIVGICKGAGLSLVITGIVNCIIRIWIRTILNMYKDEAYLTHTIPVDIKTHFISKVLASIITVLVSVLVLLVSLIIMYLNKTNITFIKESLNILSSSLNISIVGLVILVSVTLLLEIIFIVMSGFAGIVFGHSFDNKKALKSVVIAVVIYFGFNFISIIAMLIVSLLNSDFHNIIFGGNTNIEFGLLTTILLILSIKQSRMENSILLLVMLCKHGLTPIILEQLIISWILMDSSILNRRSKWELH